MDDAARPSTLSELANVYNDSRGRLRAFTGALARAAWPGRCLLCRALAPAEHRHAAIRLNVCAACLADLAPPPALLHLPWITRLHVAFAYAYPLQQLVLQAKFHGDVAALSACGAMLELKVGTYLGDIDGIVPIPLSRWRYVRRGFNQALELCRPMLITSGLPLLERSLIRIRHRQAQSVLSKTHRRQNIVGAYAATRHLDGQRLLLVDDVLTTGATLSEAARILREAGAARVDAAVLAAAPPQVSRLVTESA